MALQPTKIVAHTKYRIAPVDPRVFGGFLEHMGRAVYRGIYDPDSAHADAEGCRADVLAALRRLNMTAMRYPGGNFVSGYHWQDGVGPRAKRPTVRELAWQSIEPNRFGTDEYLRLCRNMGWTPMLTVNLGTGTPEEARDWVEYCNCPPGTRYADLRAAHGSREPHAVKLWCLGNEMDGPWQLGHVPADQYAIRARQAAKMMKDADSTIELVACGSCGVGLPTYMEWDREVLTGLGGLADYISLHRYVGNPDGDTPDYLAVTAAIDRQIEEMDAACRFAQARARSRKRAFLCFDEWNVWYKDRRTDGAGKFAPHLIEEVYNLEDALVVAGFLHSFVRHADVVKIANLAQIRMRYAHPRTVRPPPGRRHMRTVPRHGRVPRRNQPRGPRSGPRMGARRCRRYPAVIGPEDDARAVDGERIGRLWQEANGEWIGRLTAQPLKIVGPFPNASSCLETMRLLHARAAQKAAATAADATAAKRAERLAEFRDRMERRYRRQMTEPLADFDPNRRPRSKRWNQPPPQNEMHA